MLNKNHNPYFVRKRSFVKKPKAKRKPRAPKAPQPLAYTATTRKLILTQSGMVEVQVPGVLLEPLEVE